MLSWRTNNSPESGRGLDHVTPTILAVRSAILATAWLLVLVLPQTTDLPYLPCVMSNTALAYFASTLLQNMLDVVLSGEKN